MEGIFGIGLPEILLVFVLALILLGPKDMVATARKMGVWVNKLVRSPLWREIMNTSQQLRDIPTQIVREAGLEESLKEIKGTVQQVRTDLNATTGAVANDLRQTQSEVLSQTQAAVTQAKGDFQAAVEPAPEVPPAGLPAPDSATIAPPHTSEPFSPAPPPPPPEP